MAQNNDKVSMQLRLPADLDAWFVQEAHRLGVAKHAMIVMALQDTRSERTAKVATDAQG